MPENERTETINAFQVLTADGRTYGPVATKAEAEAFREPGATLYHRAYGVHGWESRGDWS